MAPTSDELAKDRTDLAEDRTLLANERTFAGWMRTGLAAIGIALGFQALFGQIEPTWAPKVVASAILAVGVLIFAIARQRAVAVVDRLNTHRIEPFSKHHLSLLAALLAASAVALGAMIWIITW